MCITGVSFSKINERGWVGGRGGEGGREGEREKERERERDPYRRRNLVKNFADMTFASPRKSAKVLWHL